MRATLIHNATAGGSKGATPEVLLEVLLADGFEARLAPTASEADLGPALADPGDLVVLAGGDGTLRAAALHLLSRPGGPVPLAIVPLGTSNNVARSLGLTDGPPLEAARGLSQPRRVGMDVGVASGPWGERRFLESFGVGLLADLLRRYDTDAPKSVARGASALVGALTHAGPLACRLEADGEALDGGYLLVEVLNTATVSNGLRLAPGASPLDGRLDLVLVSGGAGGLPVDLVALAAGRLESLGNVTVRGVRRVRLAWDGSASHADAEVWPPAGNGTASSTEATVELLPAALELWLPGHPA